MKGKPKIERLNKLSNQLFNKLSKSNSVYLCKKYAVYAQYNQAEVNSPSLSQDILVLHRKSEIEEDSRISVLS